MVPSLCHGIKLMPCWYHAINSTPSWCWFNGTTGCLVNAKLMLWHQRVAILYRGKFLPGCHACPQLRYWTVLSAIWTTLLIRCHCLWNVALPRSYNDSCYLTSRSLLYTHVCARIRPFPVAELRLCVVNWHMKTRFWLTDDSLLSRSSNYILETP